MKNLESQLKKLEQISLDQDVKQNIRLKVLDFSYRDSQTNSKVTSPFMSWINISYHRQLIGSIAVIILLFGIPVSARQALPNSFLYPIKINFNEPLVTILTSVNKEADTRSLELTQKRLEEAVILAKNNELTPEIEQNLINNLSKNISDFKITRLQEFSDRSQSTNYAISEDSALSAFDGDESARNTKNMELKNDSTENTMLMMSSNPVEENLELKKSSTTTDDLPIQKTDTIKDKETRRLNKIVDPRLQDLANTLNDYQKDLKNQSQSNSNDYKLLKAIDKELEDLNSI